MYFTFNSWLRFDLVCGVSFITQNLLYKLVKYLITFWSKNFVMCFQGKHNGLRQSGCECSAE